MSKMRDLITLDFQLLPGNLKPAEATGQLANSPYGIVLNEQQVPVALVIPEDLQKAATQNAPSLLDPSASLPPTVIADYEVAITDLVKPDTTLKSFVNGAKGAIILDEQKNIMGVLPVQTLRRYISNRSSNNKLGIGKKPIAHANDSRLAGDPLTLTCKVICQTCGYINELEFFDRRNPPDCKNDPTHKLKA